MYWRYIYIHSIVKYTATENSPFAMLLLSYQTAMPFQKWTCSLLQNSMRCWNLEMPSIQHILYLHMFQSFLPHWMLLLCTVSRNGQNIVDVVENVFLKGIKKLTKRYHRFLSQQLAINFSEEQETACKLWFIWTQSFSVYQWTVFQEQATGFLFLFLSC